MISNCTPLIMDAVERASRRAAVVAHGEMSRGLYSLAAIAASAALVGLLGTVSQLLTHTFFSLGTSRSTALGLLAGRLSENLVFTALGLAVSIVAFIFYSHLKSRMEVFDREMEHAAAELVSRLAVHFAPAPKRMIESEQPLQALAASPKNQWFCTERMFQHAVLQLITPRLTSPFDADSVLKGGMWISFAYGFIGWLNYHGDRRPTEAAAVLVFFLVAGLGVRAGSSFSILSLCVFLEFAFWVSLVPFGWMFSSTCLLIAPSFLVGSLKAARFTAGDQQGRVARLWAALHPIPAIAVVLCGLAACAAVVYKALFPFPDA